MSKTKYVACIDVGTTGCRTIIYSDEGDLIAQAYKEYGHIFLSPTWIDHDPHTWLEAARDTLKRATGQLAARGDSISAICVISQRATFTPVDKKGQALANAILWQDKRAISQTQFIKDSFGEDYIYKRTGLRVDPYFSLPKLLWLKENNPQIFHNSHSFLAVHDLIINHLTGQFVTDWTQASRTMLFNIESLEWDSELCDAFEIPIEKLPKAVPPGTVVGGLRNSVMKDLGIERSIPVAAVGGDQQAAAVGLGVVTPGLMCANTGTGSFILAHSDKPAFDEECRIICTASAVPGKWLMEAGIFTSGAVYRWFRDNFFEGYTAEHMHIDAYDILNREVEKSKIGAEGVLLLPHFAGSAAPYWNPNARGIIFGLSLGHKRSSVIRAILEGLAFEIYKNIKIIERLVGGAREIRVSGGAARSGTFNQIQADVYGKPVIRGTSEQSSALGALIMALTSMGAYPDVESAARHLIRFNIHDRRTPNEKAHELYEKMAALHDHLYEALNSRNIYEKANEILELVGKL